jgi:hypothetical protein
MGALGFSKRGMMPYNGAAWILLRRGKSADADASASSMLAAGREKERGWAGAQCEAGVVQSCWHGEVRCQGEENAPASWGCLRGLP